MLESRAELHRVYEGMAALGIVEHVGERHLGLFRTTRYPEKDHGPEAAIMQQDPGGYLAVRSAPRRHAAQPADRCQDHGPDRPAVRGGAARQDSSGCGSKPGAGNWRMDIGLSRAVADELRMVRLAEAEAVT